LLAALENLPELQNLNIDGIPHISEVDSYLKTRDLKVDWEIESGDELSELEN